MSNPHDHHDELDLDAETVRDLEPRADDEESIQGGAADTPTKAVGCVLSANCLSAGCVGKGG
jgi:hypothetical protein